MSDAPTPRQKELIARMIRGQVLGEFIFDVHGHTSSGWTAAAIFDGSAEAMHRDMDLLGFTGTAVSAVCSMSGVDFERANDELARDIGKLKNRIAAYVGIDIRHRKNMSDSVLGYLARGFRGGKIYSRSGVAYDDPRYDHVFEIFAARQLPVLAHCWGAALITQLAGAARKFPKVNFIAAHTGSADLPVYIDLAGKIDNLYIDTAYSGGRPGEIEEVVKRIGSKKLVFGSDSLLLSAAQQVGRVIAARISDDERRDILGLNAKRLFPWIEPRELPKESALPEVTKKI